MQVVYALGEFPKEFSKAIFLAGPTPRFKDVKSWRPDVIKILEEKGYDGVVFVPEPRDGEFKFEYNDQVAWEERGLNLADCIIFWIPRDLETLPGFTTNVEFGEWMKSGKINLGAPEFAPKLTYLRFKCNEYNVSHAYDIEETIDKALEMIGEGAFRQGGECDVPLHIWNTQLFQTWYVTQKKAGNRLDGAIVKWATWAGRNKKFLFMWALHVNVYVAKEDRNKTNEIIIARPDISTVVLYWKGISILDSIVILIKEFRSPVSNSESVVYELPGGSSFKPGKDPLLIAADEVREETGFEMSPTRIEAFAAKQLVATLSIHKAHAFSAEISEEEVEWFKMRAGVKNGVAGDSEQTYVEVRTVREILTENLVDWSMLGMILSVLVNKFSE